MFRPRSIVAALVLTGSLAGITADAAQPPLPSPPRVIHKIGSTVGAAASRVRHDLTPRKRHRVRRVKHVRHTPVRHIVRHPVR